MLKEAGDVILPWFAQYLVTKRVAVEQNFQPLYNNFLLVLNNAALDDLIENETYRSVEGLLKSVKKQSRRTFGERQMLKNLGNWLGIISIGRDKPILVNDLNLKFLLLEAFYEGEHGLLCVVPFVAKTIVSSRKSTVGYFCKRL